MDYNNYSTALDNKSLSKINKNYIYKNEQQKSYIILPETLKTPIQLLEQNSLDKFNSYINSTKIAKNNLNYLLCFCLQSFSKNNKIIEQIKLLINKGGDIDSKFKYCYESNNNDPKLDDKDNISLLMYACLYNNKKLVELFISKNNINLIDKNGKNAIFYLFTNINSNNKNEDIECANIIKLLINKGININCAAKIEKGNKIYKHSPLSFAATNNLFYSFKELMNNGANLNFVTEPEGDTILHIAVKIINHEMIKLLLLTNHINLEKRNKEGKTARDLALEIEPDSIIYNLIVEKISETDNSERKKSDELSFDERSKRDYEQSDNNINLSSNYLTEIKDNNIIKTISIKNENNKKDLTKIKSLLKKYNENKKNILNKYIKEIKNNPTNMKIYAKVSKEKIKLNNINRNNTNLDKIIDFIILENDENQRPIVSIDLLSKKFINYKKDFNNSNGENKNRKKNVINKITFLNNNIDKNINININKDLTKNNEMIQLKENNISLQNELENIRIDKNNLTKDIQDKNNYISQLEINNNKQIDILNNKIKNLENEKDLLNKKIKNLESEKEALNQNIIQIKKEYSELNQKMEKIIKEKENEKLDKTPLNNLIKSNSIYYSQYLNKKFIHFNYEEDYKIDSLSLDLYDFENFVTMRIEKEKDIYDTLIQNVQNSIDKSIQNYEVNLYGSHATNLCLPWSDLDIVLIKKNNINSENDQNISSENNNNLLILSNLYEYIRNEPWVKECKLISKAAVPIIKLVSIEKYNYKSIDISIQDDKHFGLKCVELVKQFIEEYKSLKPLVLAIKNILKRAYLNDPYKGGISSYGLILMIIYFFQKQKLSGVDISPGENNSNLGKLFFEFIRFYAIFFESNKIIININDNEKIFNEFEYHNMGHSSDLIIIDPLNHYNNVAKSCLQFYNIKISFLICLKTLQEDCECGCHYNQIGENYDNLKEEHCILKRIFNSVKRFT